MKATDAKRDSTPAASAEAEHKPFVPDNTTMPEFTWSAVLVGVVLGIVFGASSLYLTLKVGLTVSASIPVAVLSITLFRAVSRVTGFRPTSILENNIVQTTGSAGESIAFGVGVTMPALMLLGFDLDPLRVLVVSLLGGLLGILMMIPLRRAFVVKMHRELLYPEGTACAQVLISGDKGGSSGKLVFIGFGIAFVHKLATLAVNYLRETVAVPLGNKFSRVAQVSADMAPELLGVGFIIGVRTAAVMMAGAVVGNLVIVPLIQTFGDGVNGPISPGTTLIRDMALKDIQANYLRYIGAGCVTAAGIISMLRTLPLIIRTAATGLRGLGAAGGSAAAGTTRRRTDWDMSMGVVAVGSLLLLGLLTVFLLRDVGPTASILGAALVLLFGFLFVTVSSRLVGEIGSSSNPISGMTVATLSLTCLIFLMLGMTGSTERVLALSIAAVVCIAASNGGTTSQDLKTGYLVGGTPYWQQWAILIGALTSAVVIGGTLWLFNQAGTVYTTKDLPNVELTQPQYDQLTEKTVYEGREYRVWRTKRQPEGFPNVKDGKYYVGDDRRIAVLEDPAITGNRTERDDGSEVKLKFDAPKTQVMGIIINGVLEQTLNWGLILAGALLALGLELCGVSSLAFAVGVYIPMQYTTPIFFGGIVRALVDRLRRPASTTNEAKAIADNDTSPGVLLSSGYIAGGSLAGVLVAFMEFSPALKSGVDLKSLLHAQTSWIAAAVFAVLVVILIVVGGRRDSAESK